MTRANSAKARMAAGGVALGLIVRTVRSGEIARIARASGHDFLFLDTQHALFSTDALERILEAAAGVGLAALVRVRSCDDPDLSRCLDAGAAGIIVPDVSTPDQAARAVRAARFAPRGRRSLPGPLARREGESVEAATRAIDDAILLVCMIETREGVANADAIAAVDGVDVLHVGCVDLLHDLGKSGAFGDPEAMAAVATVCAAARRHGRHAGFGGDRDPARQAEVIRGGVRFMTTQTDTALLEAEATRVVAGLREREARAGETAAPGAGL
jgi:staphyloferrin B biosynthesis citrate synthase